MQVILLLKIVLEKKQLAVQGIELVIFFCLYPSSMLSMYVQCTLCTVLYTYIYARCLYIYVGEQCHQLNSIANSELPQPTELLPIICLNIEVNYVFFYIFFNTQFRVLVLDETRTIFGIYSRIFCKTVFYR